MADIVERLRSPDAGWTGDAVCVDADTAEDGAKEIERLRAAILWALGEQPDANGHWFGDKEPEPHGRQRPFWWRTHLRELAGMKSAKNPDQQSDGGSH
jgi:hypothetical protein